MTEAQSLTTLGDRPLVVLTAEKDAQGGWMAAQDELAALSTNSVHRTLPNADHAMLTAAAGDRRRVQPSRSATSSTPSAPVTPSPERQADMKTKTLIAAIAAVIRAVGLRNFNHQRYAHHFARHHDHDDVVHDHQRTIIRPR